MEIKLGYIGLGKMGKNMVLRLLEQGIEVVAWNRSSEPLEEAVKAGARRADNIESLVGQLSSPRVIWLMLTAGGAIDEIIEKLIPLLAKGDLIIDGGNSFYEDTLRRGKILSEKGLHFMDIGVSGGPGGARTGACLMVGGEEDDYQRALPIVKAASAPEAYGYFGRVGSGHFAKMIHNGIEYGMMESIAEGATILKNSEFNFDLADVFRVYNNRSVIESRLVGWAREALTENQNLSETSSKVESTGEGGWTVEVAKKLGIDTPVFEDSLKIRQNSAKDPENSPSGFRNKVVSALRGKFGQHEVKKS